jgi:hypothetical protein
MGDATMKNFDDQQDPTEETRAPNFQQIFRQFPDAACCKDDALEAICQLLDEAYGVQCRHCGDNNTHRQYGSRIRICLTCNRERSVTAGTFFHNMRKPVGWYRALVVFDRGIVCSKAELTRITSLAGSSAGNIFNKITKTILDELFSDDGNFVLLDSSLLLKLFGKRSIETSRHQPPKSEQQEYEERVGAHELQSVPMQIEQMNMIPAAEYVYNLLSEKALSSDELVTSATINHGDVIAGVTMLELAGLVHTDKQGRLAVEKQRVFAAGSLEVSAALEGVELGTVVERLVVFIKEKFHAVSRKYVQLYLAAHWWQQQKNSWHQGTISKMCAKTAYFRGKDLLHYVSGILVKAACPLPTTT